MGLIVGGLLGLIFGFGLGAYSLPFIVAERGPDETVLAGVDASAKRHGIFVRDLPGSDPPHYGDGEIIYSVENGTTYITLQGMRRQARITYFFSRRNMSTPKPAFRLSRPKASV